MSEHFNELSPEKEVMLYFISCYVGVIVLATFCICWRFKGYNESDPKLYQVIKTIGKRESCHQGGRHRAVPRERDPDVPGVRRRDARARIQQQAQREEKSSQEENEGKVGAKKLRKLQDKEEKRFRREAEELERVERRKAQEEREQRKKQEEEEERAEEEKKAEIERQEEEERARREEEEYRRMREDFAVEEEGEVEQGEEERSNLLQEFIEFVKDTKVVFLEDLASHFGLRTQEAINRIQDLLKEGTITGVIDDRGKFIYLSHDELKAVAEFVERRGRISISELARASNSLVNLEVS